MKVFTIGRKDCQILLQDKEAQVSRRHAELTVTDKNTYYLVDCGSNNGTFVKRQGAWKQIRQDYVTENEEIRFGGHLVITVQELLHRASAAR
jgi:pSer/pThr/pTyr-binding forkhead associated (FHA) protein